jgi:hypothetical protein
VVPVHDGRLVEEGEFPQEATSLLSLDYLTPTLSITSLFF